MATVNGDAAVSVDAPVNHIPASPEASNKRKRENSTSDERDHNSARIAQIQRDLLPVLERHDTVPSLLKHVLSSKEPSQKKAKLATPADDASIANKLSNASYTSLEQIKVDVSDASEAVVLSIREKTREGSQIGRPSVEDLKLIQRVQMLEAMVKDMVNRELDYVGTEVQAVKKEESRTPVVNGAPERKTGTVLTLFGNAPTPKQLFSSVQNAPSNRRDPAVKLELPVEEMSLPIGITATKVMAPPEEQTKPGPTFGEAFAPPYSLSALLPPKAHKRPTTRDTSITWEFKDPVNRNSKKGGYTVQVQTSGAWLGYGGKDSSADPTSEKRKQRDRALSGGENLQKVSPEALVEDELAREEAALFRRAYSSFAPSYDNNGAVVPVQTKNNVWWAKTGERRFNETFAIDPALLDDQPMRSNKVEDLPLLEEDDMNKVMQSLEDLEEGLPVMEKVRSKTEVDHVLREISELLETLASYQRIRNATLATSGAVSRPPVSPAPLLTKAGKSDEPSEDEISTYNTLRHELAYLILQLPPYAVAKLDGDKLADLGVSKLITFQVKDTKGSLAEDLVTRQAKLSAMATASSLANLARPNSSAGQHYSTTAQRTPAIGQAANTRYGQQYGSRTPAPPPQFSRSASNQSYGTPSASVPRPAYGSSTQQYGRTGAPPPPQYGQANGQQYYQQRPMQQTPGGYGALQQFQQTPQAQRPAYPPQQQTPQHQYQQRSHTAALSAVGYQSNTPQQQNYARTASPIKPGGYAPPMQQQSQPQAMSQQPSRQGYVPPQQPQQQPGSGRATPVNYPSQPQTPVNGVQQQQQQQPPRAVAPRPSSATPQPQGQAGAPLPQGQAGVNGTT